MNRLQQNRIQTVGYCRDSHITNNVDELRGSGVISWLKGFRDRATKRFLEDRPKVLTDLLEKDGDQIITKIEVCRVPIKGAFATGLNILTLGRLKREMKKKGYDNLYHLYMVLYLANGKVYSIEKNQRVNVLDSKKEGPADACQPPLIYGKETLGQFLMDAENKNIKGFYRYNAFLDNCQKWIYDIMNSNGITQFNKFILQDVSTLAPSYLSRIVRGITDVAGAVDYAIRGGEYE
jgi:hypothetical protein